MFKHWRNRSAGELDRADGVLVFTIIMIPLLFLCFGFGLDMTKNSYIKSSLNTMAQNAADLAIQKIDARGGLTPAAATSFVAEYQKQRGLTDEYPDSSAESNTFMGASACSTMEVDGKKRSLPYIKFSYDTGRGNGSVDRTNQFTWENGKYSDIKLNPSARYRSFSATIYDSASNFVLGLSGMPCQNFEVKTSGVAFGANEDLQEQPDITYNLQSKEVKVCAMVGVSRLVTLLSRADLAATPPAGFSWKQTVVSGLPADATIAETKVGSSWQSYVLNFSGKLPSDIIIEYTLLNADKKPISNTITVTVKPGCTFTPL